MVALPASHPYKATTRLESAEHDHKTVEESAAREDANEQRFDETCIFHGIHYLFLSLISAIVVIIILRDRTAGALRNSTNVRRESYCWVNFVGWEGEPLTDSPPAHTPAEGTRLPLPVSPRSRLHLGASRTNLPDSAAPRCRQSR